MLNAKFKENILIPSFSVSYPDPYSMVFWIRIQIRNRDSYPDLATGT